MSNNTIIKVMSRNQSQANKTMRMILMLLVLLPSLAVLSISVLTGVNGERVLKKQARELLHNRTSESAQYARAFLANVQSQVEMSHKLFGDGLQIDSDLQALEDYYIAQLEVQPVVAGLYSSNMQGDFYYVSRSIEPSKGKYRVKVIRRTADEVITKVWWREANDPQKKFLEELPDDGFDSRMRPWFIDATSKKTMIWTDPYVFFTTQRLGITVAAPYEDEVTGRVLGALGIDVELTEMASFLKALDKTRFGSSFIVTHKGTFIADSEMTKSGLSLTSPTLQSVEESNNALVKKAYAAILAGDKKDFSVEGAEYLVDAIPLSLEQSVPWYIVSYAKKDDFLQEITSNNRRNYWLAGLVTLLSVLLGWWFAKVLSRPVQDLEDQANRDQLTGLYNRHYLNNNVDYILEQAERNTTVTSFAILDIDKFKEVNDSYGHDFGDAVLKNFAKRFQNKLRTDDLLVRLGGEEFLLILPNTSAENAELILNQRREAVNARPYVSHGAEAIVTFSAGVVDVEGNQVSFQEIYKRADQALYRAKQQGRDRVVAVS